MVQAKLDMKLRHVPLLLAREMLRTKDGRAAFGGVAQKVFTRPDDIAEFLAIYWKDNKDEPLAKQAKRYVGEAFRRFDEYQLAKYNGGQKAVKLRDAIRITRPKPKDAAQAELWRKLVKGELATPDTWEVELSKGGDKKTSWTRLLSRAEARRAGDAPQHPEHARSRGAGRADSGGYRPHSGGEVAADQLHCRRARNPQFEPELEAKFFECFAEKPKLSGNTIVLIDVSGSMDSKLSGRSELTRMDVGMFARDDRPGGV